jgi:glycosyltransferase involved in cell wall biosynthesis
MPGREAEAVSVVIPTFNSATTLSPLVHQIEEVFAQLDRDVEILLIDDGSTDSTWDVIGALTRQHPFVRGLQLMRNYGQHNALLAGIRAATMPIVVTIDDDGQHPPEAIPDLLARLEEGYDVVYGTPLRPQHKRWRRLSSALVRFAFRTAMSVDLAYAVSSFRALRTKLRDGFATFDGPYVMIDVLLSWSTERFGVVDVTHQPRREGRSTYTFRKLLGLALTLLTGFSVAPLRFASLVGFLFTLLGFGLLVGAAVSKWVIHTSSVPGLAWLTSVIAIFSGVQLFTLGLIGEYLARMHLRMMEQPTYAVRSEVGAGVNTEEVVGRRERHA